jgi:HD-like signal output (HDOD) protein
MRELEKLPQADRALASVEMETKAYGISHPEILARVLKSWKFPQDLYEAVEQHHLEYEPGEPLARVLRYAARFSEMILNGDDQVELGSISIAEVADYRKIIRGARNFMDQMSHQSLAGRFG